MNELADDPWQRHRLAVVFLYVSLCAGLTQTVACVTQENSDEQTCGKFYLGYLFFHWLVANPEWLTAIATGFIGYFTFSLKVSTDRLWDAGERQLRIAERSADSAKASADHIVNTERAWILVHQIEPTLNLLTWIGDPAGVIFGINWGYKNYGKSPAFVTKVSAELLVFEADAHPSPSDFSDKESLVSEIPVAPGFSREINWVAYERGITEQDRLAFVARQRGLFFIGVVEYRDIFGSPHETRFCLLYEQDPGLKNPPFAWRYYGGKEYNDHS